MSKDVEGVNRVGDMAAKIGVDTSGTFTDLIYVDENESNIAKVLSTPDHSARAVLTGLRQLCPELTDVNIVHGSTVATNARLERKGARVQPGGRRIGQNGRKPIDSPEMSLEITFKI